MSGVSVSRAHNCQRVWCGSLGPIGTRGFGLRQAGSGRVGMMRLDGIMQRVGGNGEKGAFPVIELWLQLPTVLKG